MTSTMLPLIVPSQDGILVGLVGNLSLVGWSWMTRRMTKSVRSTSDNRVVHRFELLVFSTFIPVEISQSHLIYLFTIHNNISAHIVPSLETRERERQRVRYRTHRTSSFIALLLKLYDNHIINLNSLLHHGYK